METKSIADDINTFKSQSIFTRKERAFAEVIFSETFFEFLEINTKELSEENDPKNAESFMNLMREMEESIQHLKGEHVDTRVQTMVFVKALITVVMDATSLVFRNK